MSIYHVLRSGIHTSMKVVANIHGNMVPVPFNLHSIDMVF